MIVLFNVKITDVRMGYPYHIGRGSWMPNPQRIDVFKYCLASTVALEPLVSKFHLYITLAPECEARRAELEAFIHEIIPADKLHLVWARNDYGRDWIRTTDEILSDPNELIWLACNDDHIFIDYNLDVVQSAVTTLDQDPDPNAVMIYSHWPEQIRMSRFYKGELTADGNLVKFAWENFDGIMILKAGRFKQYWTRDYGDALMFKVDYLGGLYGYKCPGNVYAPTRELVRHYEGYAHVNQTAEMANLVPPLYVPQGFFERDLKVRVGYPERKDGWQNLYSAAEWLYNANPNGVEHRWCVEDIPLFWKPYISELDVNLDQNVGQLHQARNAAFLAATHIPMRCFDIDFTHENHHPAEWFDKQLLK